jgi:predicted lipoprotein with Yx(FWY)xxD motif
MKTPKLLFAAAATFALTGCETYAPAPAPIVPAAATTITTATKAPFGTYLVDGAGRALYILEGERQPTGTHRCMGECLRVWPPLVTAAPPTVGSGVNPALLGNMTMHGVAHVTYAGWPLYYYARDRSPGDTTGQHVTDTWGTWHLLAPSGQPIRPRA